jgi:hypothetical protein
MLPSGLMDMGWPLVPLVTDLYPRCVLVLTAIGRVGRKEDTIMRHVYPVQYGKDEGLWNRKSPSTRKTCKASSRSV